MDLARELKKKQQIWNMKVTVIPIIIDALSTIRRQLVQGHENFEITGLIKTIQTTVLLRLARIQRRVLDTREDLLLLRLQWKTIR